MANQYTKKEGDRFEWQAIAMILLLITVYVAYSNGWIAWYLVVPVICVVVTRWLICTHELFHLRDADQVNPFTRFLLMPVTPLNIGYAEYRKIHLEHHVHNASEYDPEHYHIRGGYLLSLLNAMTYPEQSTLRYIRHNGIDERYSTDMFWRMLLFVGLFVVNSQLFLSSFICLRIIHGLNIWFFFYHLHNRSHEIGTFGVQIPRWLKPTMSMIFGKATVDVIAYHDIHHLHPNSAHYHLHQLKNPADASKVA